MNMRRMFLLLMAAALGTLVGCAGVGRLETPVVQATRAIVKVQTVGTLPSGTNIGGIQATVTYPATKGLSITADSVGASGADTGSLFAANTNNPGLVVVGLATHPGMQTGEFATLTFSIAPGNYQLSAGDFAIAAGAKGINSNGVPLPEIAVTIQDVSIQ